MAKVTPDPFTSEIMRQALRYAGKDPREAQELALPRQADPYSHALSSSTQRPALGEISDPALEEAVKIASDTSEKNVRRQILCAVYRRLLQMPDTELSTHFPGTRTQRDQWVRRGLLRLVEKASPSLRERLTRYSRKRGDL